MEFSQNTEVPSLGDEKIELIQRQIVELQDTVVALSESIRETQRYLIRMAQNQALVTKQVAQWPYIVVNDSTLKPNKKNTKKSSDDDFGTEN